MTLCIAWKDKQFISFSSDSRLSLGDDKHTDIGIKVMSIPVRIDNPFPEGGGPGSTAYAQRIGLCYCGDTFSAHLIKETLQEHLQSLQFLPLYNVLSFGSICNLVAKVSGDIARSLKADLDWRDTSIDFLIGGYCPLENRVVVNWMQIEDTGSDIRVRYQEVLKSIGDHITLGSGKAKADRLIAAELTSVDHKLLSVLRKVCLDEDEQTVGGYVQYGRFVGQDFQIVGVQNYRIDDNGLMEFAYTFRGMDVFAKDGKYGTNALVLTGKFVAPFHDEINDTLWGKGNWPPK